MSDTPHFFPQSSLLTTSKRKQTSSTHTTEVEQLVIESTSKKARVEAMQRSFQAFSGGSPEEFDHDIGTEEEAVVARRQPENAEAELRRLQKDWTAPIYAFFKPSPTIEYIGGRRAHVFECVAKTCKARGGKARQVNRYLDKADARSTSNLRKHAKVCWGAEIVETADRTKNIEATRALIAGMVSRSDPGSSSSAPAPGGMGKGKLSYILATPAR